MDETIVLIEDIDSKTKNQTLNEQNKDLELSNNLKPESPKQ